MCSLFTLILNLVSNNLLIVSLIVLLSAWQLPVGWMVFVVVHGEVLAACSTHKCTSVSCCDLALLVALHASHLDGTDLSNPAHAQC